MQTLNVALGERSYPIHIGAGLLARAELIAERLPKKKAAIVTNVTVAPRYLAPLQRALEARGVEVVPITLPDDLQAVVGQGLAVSVGGNLAQDDVQVAVRVVTSEPDAAKGVVEDVRGVLADPMVGLGGQVPPIDSAPTPEPGVKLKTSAGCPLMSSSIAPAPL